MVVRMRITAPFCVIFLCAACQSAAPKGNPFASAAPVAVDQGSHFSGRVQERLGAGSYVYLRVARPDGGSSWVVSLKALTPPDDVVDVRVVRRSESFESKRLKRTFAPLHFAIIQKDQS